MVKTFPNKKMSNMKVAPVGSFLVSILLSANALGVPITYSFDMPAFPTTFASDALGGLTSVLELTVDNGSTSISNQSYTNQQILTISATVGSETTALTVGDPGTASDIRGSAIWITTDGTGIPTLDLTISTSMEVVLVALNSISVPDLGFLQLASVGPSGASHYTVQQSTGELGVFRPNISGPPPPVMGTFIGCQGCTLVPDPTPVPEPSTFGLLGASLLALGFTRRRRSA